VSLEIRDKESARRKASSYTGQHNTEKREHTSVPKQTQDVKRSHFILNTCQWDLHMQSRPLKGAGSEAKQSMRDPYKDLCKKNKQSR
jgi:hypothetical protein